MENIIKKAIEGGYLYVKDKTPQQIDWLIRTFKNREKEVTLDPLFWQALGKACGWIHKFYCDEGSGNSWYCRECGRAKTAETRKEVCSKMHIYYALRFHEINLTQGWDKAVEYLTNLIK